MKFDLVINASRKAANFLVRDFNEISYFKNSASKVRDFIEKSKIRTQGLILNELERYFPDHQILSRSCASSQPEGNYIVFDPLEGAINMESLMPFFAITTLLSTTVKNVTTKFAVMNFPLLDQICYTATGENVWLENYQSSHKKRGLASSINNLIAAKEISDELFIFAKQNALELSTLRSFGSSSYCSLLFASGAAGQCVIDDIDWLAWQISDLVAQNAGGKFSQNGPLSFYSALKSGNNKTLRLVK